MAKQEAIFIVDTSHPTSETALPIDEDILHVVISEENILAPPGHRSLRIFRATKATELLRNVRVLLSLGSQWEIRRCIVIAGPRGRKNKIAQGLLYALFLSRNVEWFDGLLLNSIYSVPVQTLKTVVKGAAMALLRPIKARLYGFSERSHRRRMAGGLSKEESLFGLYSRNDSFVLPPDAVHSEPGESLYGSVSPGWYLPDFSRRFQRYSVQTNRYHLYNVSLHVEKINQLEEESALFRDGRILDYPYFVGSRGQTHTYLVNSRRDVKEAERGVNLLAHTSGYYHWLIEGIPRLLDLIDDGVDFERYPLIMPPLASYHREILEIFDISPVRHVITLDKGDWCHVEDCIFPTANFPFANADVEDPSGQPNRGLLLRLRDRILGRLGLRVGSTTKRGRGLYISRANAGWRRFCPETEDKVTSCLGQFGYERIFLEDFPWVEQVKIMSEAEKVAGLHGAGLANILFTNAESILEFQNPLETRAYFAVMARELGISYGMVVGKQTKGSQIFTDLCVDMDHLRHLLNQMNLYRNLFDLRSQQGSS